MTTTRPGSKKAALTKEEILRKLIERMKKPLRERNKHLRDLLGDEIVDDWEQAWADEEDAPEDAPDILDRDGID